MTLEESRGMPDPATAGVHPAADLFPLVEGAEFEELVEDIRAHGLRVPILVNTEGRVLDGRNRLRACRAAGVEPQFETWSGEGSPLELVVSLNLHRRHLNESQRALVAARLKEKLAAENHNHLISKGISSANLRSGKSAEKAATLLNVSSRSVEHAAKLLREGDQRVLRLVETGQLSVSAAADQLQATPSRKTKATEQFPVLYVEPVWQRNGRPRKGTAPVTEVAAPDAVVFLWTPNRELPKGIMLLRRWRFSYEAALTWPSAGAPSSAYLSDQQNLLLIGVRGSPPELAAGAGAPGTAGRRRDEIREWIEHLFPKAPKADLSGAEPRPGWRAPGPL